MSLKVFAATWLVIHIVILAYGDVIRPMMIEIIGDNRELHEILASGLSTAAAWGVIRITEHRRRQAFDRASYLQGQIAEHLSLTTRTEL